MLTRKRKAMFVVGPHLWTTQRRLGMKDVEVTFPLIEDITMNVASLYGMIMPGEDSTKAVRAVFVIDPQGIIRTIIYYPLNLGRNFDGLKRVIIALQAADALSVATPADWRPACPRSFPRPVPAAPPETESRAKRKA